MRLFLANINFFLRPSSSPFRDHVNNEPLSLSSGTPSELLFADQFNTDIAKVKQSIEGVGPTKKKRDRKTRSGRVYLVLYITPCDLWSVVATLFFPRYYCFGKTGRTYALVSLLLLFVHVQVSEKEGRTKIYGKSKEFPVLFLVYNFLIITWHCFSCPNSLVFDIFLVQLNDIELMNHHF